MSLAEASIGADLTRNGAEPTLQRIKKLNQIGLRWVVAEYATDQCWLDNRLVGYVVGGNVQGEPCDAYFENPRSGEVAATLVNTDVSVDRPTARLMLMEKVLEAVVEPRTALQVAS
jgi:hypothetical protein